MEKLARRAQIYYNMSAKEKQVREFLFNRLQNAYFAAKIMLIDCKDSNMLPIDKRLDWLDSYDVVGVMYGYDRDGTCQEQA